LNLQPNRISIAVIHLIQKARTHRAGIIPSRIGDCHIPFLPPFIPKRQKVILLYRILPHGSSDIL